MILRLYPNVGDKNVKAVSVEGDLLFGIVGLACVDIYPLTEEELPYLYHTVASYQVTSYLP